MTHPTTEERELPAEVHPVAAVLPWYVNGSLPAFECASVAEHLKNCAACRAELDSLVKFTIRLRGTYQAMPDPSPQVRKAVMVEVRPSASAATRGRSDESQTAIDRLAEFIRGWFMPKWAPTFAVTLLVAQLGLIVWSMQAGQLESPVTSRSLAPAAVRISVVFNPSATERAIRNGLRDLGAKLVSGPTDEGAYLIEIAPGDAQVLQRKLTAFRENHELVLRVQPN